ncbi:YoeB-YefM toxin-antitoxin system antitoxin YefM [Salmonella enterica subsp. enterica serovar Ball]|uniref:YoeB-YefM toxin-antitoxin system antitoxin YefM n=1 Tax=Salmonella sp. SAL04162 TaxID=3159782 RepID=UPI000DF09A18|nr:type II toxin-antitoxin system prevent-host-death family antitoxin [Salmonella enterica subsp. diarizonae serovar 59:z10:-]EBE4781976.1 YoeB-YefM toxin-antitoxin system antitoxin YefM [Salmonella enterica]EBV5085241.1 type II toxin-antitoxin system Phd/YefM family antitoxin [Salmonella enterica subsp. enterica serovar Minnesota]ECI4647501.1 type II toxin-antitoxin system Phd/YefM family antitoxin [Salmonella enterica subsp. salamae]EDV5023479.1 YoeB-YefM toxin-antitoxin system antitoxin YefM
MRTISYSEARQNLSATMVKTVEDHAPILITRQNGESCVLMSLEEYNSLEETAYLLRSPSNARRLADSIESLKSGRGIEKDIIE